MQKMLPLSIVACLCLQPTVQAAVEEVGPRAIIEKAVKATGGAANLAKLKVTRSKFKGTVDVQGMTANVTGEVLVQLPAQMRMNMNAEIQGQNFPITYVLNGAKGWLEVAGNTMELQGADLKEEQEGLYAEQVRILQPLLKDKQFRMTPLGEIKVKDRDAVGVKVTSAGHKDINLYFDKKTGLLAKDERRTLDDNKQEVTEETFYSDYQEVQGVKVPGKLLVNRDGNKFLEVDVTDYTFSDRIEETEFARPGN
jgi:hypothetical protein